MLSKISTLWEWVNEDITLSASNSGTSSSTVTKTSTYTFTQGFSKVSIPVRYTENAGGSQSSHTIDVSIKRGNTTVWSKSKTAAYQVAVDETDNVILENVGVWEILTFTLTVSGRYGTDSQTASGKFYITIIGKYTSRALIPNEVKAIWVPTYPVLFGKLKNGKRYGEITGTASDYSTWAITLGNAVGFITMEYNGDIIKVPYYN